MKKYYVLLILLLISSAHAMNTMYLSFGVGNSNLPPKDLNSKNSAHKLTLGYVMTDMIGLDGASIEFSHTDLGTNNNGMSYKYNMLGATYVFNLGMNIKPFVGGGLAVLKTDDISDDEAQTYRLIGVRFPIDKQHNHFAQVSYTDYDKDVEVTLLELLSKF